jgi:predicted ATPase
MTTSYHSNRIVLTGPPCSGKSSIIHSLELKGKKIVHEVAREEISYFQKYEPHKLPWENRDFFQQHLETMELKNFINNKDAIFDRGLVDQIAYRKYFSIPECEKLLLNNSIYKYDKVFFLPFWEEIYQQDEQRIETKEEALKIEKLLVDAYTSFGYNLIFVPKTTIDERVSFILKNVI